MLFYVEHYRKSLFSDFLINFANLANTNEQSSSNDFFCGDHKNLFGLSVDLQSEDESEKIDTKSQDIGSEEFSTHTIESDEDLWSL